jgi:hypothetical protein
MSINVLENRLLVLKVIIMAIVLHFVIILFSNLLNDSRERGLYKSVYKRFDSKCSVIRNGKRCVLIWRKSKSFVYWLGIAVTVKCNKNRGNRALYKVFTDVTVVNVGISLGAHYFFV